MFYVIRKYDSSEGKVLSDNCKIGDVV